MTTTPTPAPASVPEIFEMETQNGDTVVVSRSYLPGMVHMETYGFEGNSELTPDEVDELIIALQAHASAARERRHHE